MKGTFKSCLRTATVLLASSIASITFAQAQMLHCPTLTANDVQSIIEDGIISTEQGYTLADEAGVTRAQVLLNEPTANPFDTYYQMMGKKKLDNQDYWIYVGNILGKASYEAKDRAKKILLSDEREFNAKYDPQGKVCVYKEIDASASIPNYPFKSTYENIILLATPYEEAFNFMRQMRMKKHHA